MRSVIRLRHRGFVESAVRVVCAAALLSGLTSATSSRHDQIFGLYVLGQSNAGSRGADQPPFIYALYPEEVVGANAGFWTRGTRPANRSAFTRFAPLRDVSTPMSGPLRATTTAFATEYQMHRSGGGRPIYAFTDFDDGMALPAFFDGNDLHNQANVLADVKQAASVAKAKGSEFQVFALLWLQGETPSRNYEAYMGRLRTEMAAAIMKITGQPQAPYFLIQQVNQGDG